MILIIILYCVCVCVTHQTLDKEMHVCMHACATNQK